MPQAQQQQKKTQQDAAPGGQQGQQQQQAKGKTPMIGGERLADAVRFNQRMGYSATQIRTWQRKLGVPADGVIGRQTTRAVFSFQISRGELANDGKMGPATTAALEQQPDQETTAAPEGPKLSRSQLRSAVRYNRSRGYSRAAVIAIQHQVGAVPDGHFGPKTVSAIAGWQAENGLDADGKVGKQTMSKLGVDTSRSQPGEQPKTPQEQQAEGQDQDGEQQEEQQQEENLPENNVTANFTWLEFRSRGDNKAVPGKLRPNVVELCKQLEVLRAAFKGRSVRLNSGYRSSWWNKRVGGATSSQHLYGRAADITVDGVAPSRVRAKILELIKQGKMKQGGVGKYTTFTHYDTRGSAARW